MIILITFTIFKYEDIAAHLAWNSHLNYPFAYTKANIYSFWIGFLLCAVAEFGIFFVYAFVKLHKAYRDAQLIKL